MLSTAFRILKILFQNVFNMRILMIYLTLYFHAKFSLSSVYFITVFNQNSHKSMAMAPMKSLWRWNYETLRGQANWGRKGALQGVCILLSNLSFHLLSSHSLGHDWPEFWASSSLGCEKYTSSRLKSHFCLWNFYRHNDSHKVSQLWSVWR